MRDETRADDLDALLTEAFGDEPVPSLSPAFEARLRSRLAAEEKAGLPARQKAILAVYCLAAAAASAAIVAGLDTEALASVPWIPVLLTLALTAAGLAPPLAALRRGESGRRLAL